MLFINSNLQFKSLGYDLFWMKSLMLTKMLHLQKQKAQKKSIFVMNPVRGLPSALPEVTLPLHRLSHYTSLRTTSYVPFHGLPLHLQPITHTIKSSLKQPFNAEYLAFIALLVIATLLSQSVFPDSSLVLFIAWFLESCILVCLSPPVCQLPTLEL